VRKVARFVVEHPIVTLVLVLAFTGLAAYQLRNLEIEPDMLKYLPQDDPDVQAFNKVGEKFGSNYIALVGLESDDIFSYETLSTIKRMTEAFEALDDVKQVNSLTNIIDIKKVEGGLEIADLIPEVPKEPRELARLKEYTLSKEMYRNRLVSEDARYALIMIRLREDANNIEVAKEIKKMSKELAAGYKLYFSGEPMVMEFANRLIPDDMRRLMPIIVLVTIIALFMSFGTVRGVVLPLVVVLLALVWVFGFMATVGFELTIIASLFPVLLIAIGSAYGIHVLSRYYEQASAAQYKQSVIGATSSVGTPVAMAALTTAIGFASLISATLPIVKQMGLALSFGIVGALVMSLALIPALLVKLGYKARPKALFSRRAERGVLETFLAGLGKFVFTHTRPITVVFVVVSIAAAIFLTKITREVNMVEYFPENSEPRVAEELMEEHFGGSQFFSLDITAENVKHPAVMHTMWKLGRELRTIEHVKNPQSISDFETEMNFQMNDRRRVPKRVEEIDNLWLFIEGKEILEQMVDGTYGEAIIQGVVDEANTKVMTDAVAEIRRLLARTPTELVAVELDKLGDDERAKVNELMADELARLAWLDLKYRTGSPPPPNELRELILEHLKGPVIPTEGDISRLEVRLANYISSEEFEIPTPRSVAEAIAAKLSQNPKAEYEEVSNELESALKEADIRYEPDQIELAADFLHTEMQDFLKETKVEHLIAALTKRFNIKLNSHYLKEDLWGDLWGINDGLVYISTQDYQRIFGKQASSSETVSYSVEFTGIPPLMTKFSDELLKSQLQSLVMALVVVFILMWILLRSITGGLLAMIPIAFTTLFDYGLMGAFGLPLDNASMMTASLAIGIGIDYTIHFITRFRLELSGGKESSDALKTTLSTTGRAILVNALAVALGFCVLLFSQVEPLRRLGGLLAITMFVAATAAMTIYPAVIIAVKPKFLEKFKKTGEVAK